MSEMRTDKHGAPDRIFLQLHGDEDAPDAPVDVTETDEVTWCWHRIFAGDVEYVRADIVDGLLDKAINSGGYG